MDPIHVIAAAALAGAILAVVALLWFQRRTRRRLDGLMSRLDQLERIAVTEEAETDSAVVVRGDIRREPAASDHDKGNLTRDVLAGRTSFVRRAVEGEPSRPASLAGQVIALVHSRIGETLTPAGLADDLAVSLRTLERGLSAELGCTPRQLILAMKMREARRLLASGRYRVNEVATRLGFSTASHFSRSFRSFYKVPPSTIVSDPES